MFNVLSNYFKEINLRIIIIKDC